MIFQTEDLSFMTPETTGFAENAFDKKDQRRGLLTGKVDSSIIPLKTKRQGNRHERGASLRQSLLHQLGKEGFNA